MHWYDNIDCIARRTCAQATLPTTWSAPSSLLLPQTIRQKSKGRAIAPATPQSSTSADLFDRLLPEKGGTMKGGGDPAHLDKHAVVDLAQAQQLQDLPRLRERGTHERISAAVAAGSMQDHSLRTGQRPNELSLSADRQCQRALRLRATHLAQDPAELLHECILPEQHPTRQGP